MDDPAQSAAHAVLAPFGDAHGGGSIVPPGPFVPRHPAQRARLIALGWISADPIGETAPAAPPVEPETDADAEES